MTQEELNSLMESEDLASEEVPAPLQPKEEEYRFSDAKNWPPPPPTEDHKVVHQLDDVTRDSEEKAGEIFDQLEAIGDSVFKIENKVKSIDKMLASQTLIFTKLTEKFPNVGAFSEGLANCTTIKNEIDEINNDVMDCNDASMQAMDIMQYQDIHRQKIERVINVMRALSQYMNSLFEGKIDDSKRVSSAVYIAGDHNDEDLASTDDIEALIASFGK